MFSRGSGTRRFQDGNFFLLIPAPGIRTFPTGGNRGTGKSQLPEIPFPSSQGNSGISPCPWKGKIPRDGGTSDDSCRDKTPGAAGAAHPWIPAFPQFLGTDGGSSLLLLGGLFRVFPFQAGSISFPVSCPAPGSRFSPTSSSSQLQRKAGGARRSLPSHKSLLWEFNSPRENTTGIPPPEFRQHQQDPGMERGEKAPKVSLNSGNFRSRSSQRSRRDGVGFGNGHSRFLALAWNGMGKVWDSRGLDRLGTGGAESRRFRVFPNQLSLRRIPGEAGEAPCPAGAPFPPGFLGIKARRSRSAAGGSRVPRSRTSRTGIPGRAGGGRAAAFPSQRGISCGLWAFYGISSKTWIFLQGPKTGNCPRRESPWEGCGASRGRGFSSPCSVCVCREQKSAPAERRNSFLPLPPPFV